MTFKSRTYSKKSFEKIQAGGIETFSVPYATVSNISFEPLNDHVHVTLKLTKPPVIGSKPMVIPLSDNILFSWNINKACFSNLLGALKSRRLVRILITFMITYAYLMNIRACKPIKRVRNDKSSKGEPIKLDFDPTKRDPHILAQVRWFDNCVCHSLTCTNRNGFNSFLNVSTQLNHGCGTAG